MKNYLGLIAFAAFALAVATSAQAMSPPPLQQPDGISAVAIAPIPAVAGDAKVSLRQALQDPSLLGTT